MTKTQSCLEGPYVLQTCGTESKPTNALLVCIYTYIHIFMLVFGGVFWFFFYQESRVITKTSSSKFWHWQPTCFRFRKWPSDPEDIKTNLGKSSWEWQWQPFLCNSSHFKAQPGSWQSQCSNLEMFSQQEQNMGFCPGESSSMSPFPVSIMCFLDWGETMHSRKKLKRW